MRHTDAFLNQLRQAAGKNIIFLPHAISQMSRPDRMITAREVRLVVEKGEIIEDYPEDKRGHSCLMLGRAIGDRAIHVVCTPTEDFVAIITAYIPSESEWENGFRERRKL